MRFVKVTGFGKATEPEKNDDQEHRPQAEIPGRTRRVQDTNWIIQTLEFELRKILKILGIVVWEQVFEGWHRLNDGNFRPLFLQNSNRRVKKRPEILCDYDVLASRLVDKVRDCRSGISG